jgi:putative spermidine/putrescine transport system substrate-binding protein
MRLDRRQWLKAMLGAGVVGLAGCRNTGPGRPLTVVAWGGSSQEADRKAYFTPFTRSTGIALQEDSWHGGLGVIRTKVLGGDSSWDVVAVETEDLILGCEEGLFEPLEWSALGGREAFLPAAVHDCGVGSMLWSYLIGYDGDRIRGEGPRSWADFWDVKRFPGRRGIRRTPKYALEIALMADGVPTAQVYSELRGLGGIDRAFRKLDRIKADTIWWSSTSQVPDLLGSGEVAMSVTSPGRLVVANRTEKRNFKTSWDGNIYAVDYWTVLRNSPRKREAMEFLRFATRPENQIRLAELIPTGLTSRKAIETVDPRYRAETPSDPRNMTNALELDANFWVEYGDQLTQRFNAWLAR